jgi:hypothetical protein
MTVARCPTHPRHPLDDCPRCERRIAEREFAELEDHPEESDREAARYEQWLDRIGEGG